VHKILEGKPEGKRQLRRARRRWKDSFKVDLRKIGWKGVDWIRDQRRAVVNTIMNLRVPQEAGDFLTS
jgi:hypothetical protein